MRNLFAMVMALGFTTLTLWSVSSAGPTTGDAGKAAAGKGKGGEARGRGMERFIKELNLTEAQQKQLKPLREEMEKKGKALREDKNLTPEQRREKMREIGKSFRDGLEKILTPEQKKKLEEARSKAKGKLAGKRPGKGKPGGGADKP